jgi:hypothetical protein
MATISTYGAESFQSDVLATQRRSREDHPIKVDKSEKTEIARLEGFDVRGVRLGDVAGRIDLIIERDHRALSFGCGINTYADSVQQIARPIKIFLGCISLSADQHNGFFRVDRQVEPPRCFLQRVRAMRDDYPRNLWSGRALR